VAASAASDIWGDLLLGAHLAGAAIELSMLGAAHACANPLTARFGTTHGIAVGLMLPAVVRLNAAVAGAGYAELIGGDARAAGERLAARLESLRAAAELPARLAEVGVSADALSALTADAAKQWTLQHNPRELGEPELVALYRSVL
jgi:alcohol dehydrogenase